MSPEINMLIADIVRTFGFPNGNRAAFKAALESLVRDAVAEHKRQRREDASPLGEEPGHVGACIDAY